MEARWTRAALLAAMLLVSMGARCSTPNFIVENPDPRLAQQIAQAAEKYRRDMAVYWLGKAMPNWSQPCVMTVHVGSGLGSGGATSFVFDRGEVFGWRMTIQGTQERIFDSVLPHEITHMIFASHFRQPVPRWADEGAASSVEHATERNRHNRMLIQFLQTDRGIAFGRMFTMTQYPRDIMPLYAQGHSLATYLIQKGGPREFLQFVGEGMQSDNWSAAVERHYGVRNAGELQNVWLAWVREGSPPLRPKSTHPADTPDGTLLAAKGRLPRPAPNLIYRTGKNDAASVDPEPYAPGSVIPAGSRGRLAAGRPAGLTSSPPTRELPADGWYAVGSRPDASTAIAGAEPRGPAGFDPASRPERIRDHLSRPQPIQQPQP